MKPDCSDPNYEYFQTVEEKKKASPKRLTDEVASISMGKWVKVRNDGLFEMTPDRIYRRRKSPPLGWVDCSQEMPKDDRIYLVQYDKEEEPSVASAETIRKCNYIIRWLNYPEPPPKKPSQQEEDDEAYDESFTKGLTATPYDAWNAALKYERNKKL